MPPKKIKDSFKYKILRRMSIDNFEKIGPDFSKLKSETDPL